MAYVTLPIKSDSIGYNPANWRFGIGFAIGDMLFWSVPLRIMIKTLFFSLFALSFAGFISGDAPSSSPSEAIQQLSVRLQIRKIQQKRVLKYDVDLLYKANGTMISYFRPPNHRYMITNSKGDLQIYSPDSNRVKMTRNEWVSSEGAVLSYFIKSETETMGLDKEGFEILEVKTEDSLRIATWGRPGESLEMQTIQKVEMVHKNGNLIFMGYVKPDGSYFKKAYFSQFSSVNGAKLPGRSIEIMWTSPKDSLVEDTRFVDYRANEQADSALTHFTIPADAEIY